MLHRIRESMKNKTFTSWVGAKNVVEIDETYVGGKSRNMHMKQRIAYMHGDKKAIVMGMKTRDTRGVRAMVIPNAKRETLQNKILENVGFAGYTYTDQHVGYENLSAFDQFIHKTVNPHSGICSRSGSHERHRELLELAQADSERHLRCC